MVLLLCQSFLYVQKEVIRVGLHSMAILQSIVMLLSGMITGMGIGNIYGATLDTNFCIGKPSSTLRNLDTNKPIEPLAACRISQVKNLIEEVQKTCDKLKDEDDPLYSTCCANRLDEVTEYLEIAEKVYMGENYIAANYWALKALKLLQEIQECCTQ